MSSLKTMTRRASILVVMFAAGFMIAGCAPAINYSFDPASSYSGLKSYTWAKGVTGQTQDLVLKNVQYYADQVLEKKGFQKTTEHPDMQMSATYETEMDRYGYQIRMLTLRVQTTDGEQLVWRGTATGAIDTDASSNDLQKAVEKILESFPPAK